MSFLNHKMHRNVFSGQDARPSNFDPVAKFCVRVINAQRWICFTVNLLC